MSKKDNVGRVAATYSSATGVSYQTSRLWVEQGFISRHYAPQRCLSESFEDSGELCAEATGWSADECLKWAEQGFVSSDIPVPDALTHEQRHLEAYVVNVLADALRDKQLDSAVFGVTRVRPLPSAPVLFVHPEMADVVVAELLPRYESGYGGLKGIPGLRPELDSDGALNLRLAKTRASIQLASGRADWCPVLPSNASPEVSEEDAGDNEEIRQFWGLGDELDPIEEDELRYWNMEPTSRKRDVVERNWLLSRILRRAAIVNITGNSHGWVNTYTHAYEDVVIEWCCGVEPQDVKSRLLKSGLVVPPPGTEIDPAPVLEHPETFYFGSGRAFIRRLSDCNISAESSMRIRSKIRERYTR